MRLRVATFNVHHCEGTDRRLDVARIAEVISETGAELVALQELDRNMPRSERVDQPAELARSCSLGMEIAFFPTLTRHGGEYGIAIAARPPLAAARYVSLPQVAREEPRGAVIASWSGLQVVCSHMATTRRVLKVQTPALAAVAAALPRPAVVMGDLNQTRRHLTPLLQAGFRGAFGHGTLPRRFPKRQIDHILVSPGIELLRSWTLRTKGSDHLPLVAELELPTVS